MQVVSREDWLAARRVLLEQEKAHTRERARLAEQRRALPWVRVDPGYTLADENGEVPLSNVFGEQSQLVVYHLMFGDGWTRPCIGCTQWANALNGTTATFAAADARLVAVSSAPVAQLLAERERQGWTFPWYSAANSDFNVDFHGASRDPAETEREVGGEVVGFDRGENHGVTVFCKDEAGDIYQTYSCYNRGIEPMNGAFGYYDVLPKGRAW